MARTTASHDSWYHQLTIRFADDDEIVIPIEMTQTGTHIPSFPHGPSDWTRLEYCRCPDCSLTDRAEICPAAASLEATMARFDGHDSYEKVTAEAIDGADRKTEVEWTLQEVGTVLVQIAVFSSGCPIGRRYRGMLRNLRPFATKRELIKHLIGRMVLQHRGELALVEAQKDDFFEPLQVVFKNLSLRISETFSSDAAANSIIRMSAFTMLVPYEIGEALRQLSEEMGWEMPGEDEKTPPETPALDEEPPDTPPTPEPSGALLDRVRAFFTKKGE